MAQGTRLWRTYATQKYKSGFTSLSVAGQAQKIHPPSTLIGSVVVHIISYVFSLFYIAVISVTVSAGWRGARARGRGTETWADTWEPGAGQRRSRKPQAGGLGDDQTGGDPLAEGPEASGKGKTPLAAKVEPFRRIMPKA